MKYDICPDANFISQEYGPTSYDGEWPSDAPGGHVHAGIDLGHASGGNRICGKPVYAPRAGRIVEMRDPHKYLGDSAVAMEFIELINGVRVKVYLELGHLSSSIVKPGDWVEAGQQVGNVGTKGASTACHLHIEARLDGPVQDVSHHWPDQRIIDPSRFLTIVADPQEDDMTPEQDKLLRQIYNALYSEQPPAVKADTTKILAKLNAGATGDGLPQDVQDAIKVIAAHLK